MVRPLVVVLAMALLATCMPFASSPGASPSVAVSTAPTPRAADGPVGATLPPVDASCRFSPTGSTVPRDVFIAVADNGSNGVAFVLDAVTGVERGRLQIAGAPEMAVDWPGRRLLVFCGSRLSGLQPRDARGGMERSRSGSSHHQGARRLPALAVSDAGTLAFELHYRTLRPGDGNAPGASRTWLVGRDLSTGVPKGEVDLGVCGAGRLFAGSVDSAYVLCRDGLHAIDRGTWTDRRTYTFSASVGPVGLVRSAFLYGVTSDLSVLMLDLHTGVTTPIGKGGPRGSSQAWGRLAVAPYGETVWVVAKRAGDLTEFGPDTLTVLDLSTWNRTDIPVPGLRGVGLVGTHVVYGTNGRIRALDGAFDVPLLTGPVEFWQFFGPPSSAS